MIPKSKRQRLNSSIGLDVHRTHTPYYTWEHRGVYSFNYEGKEYTDSTLGGLYALASEVGVEIHPYCG